MPNFASAIQKAIDKVASIEGFGQFVFFSCSQIKGVRNIGSA